ncbi:conserved unknown protein [Ectocarpus siliculosus]|uniref:Translation initiation factor IF-3 n=1 Tax=Ectocarpus siliculosus TaxID=2880 RepID=D8LS76_ECTSI|nr:conserved unknown protein [Ectocarpus siliculosus]|eukprot:CBN75133.1 conserved unknown protein [Ectocarpus siliculosus]
MRLASPDAARRGVAPSVLSSVLGSCYLLLTLVDRSTAFVANGCVRTAQPGALVRPCSGSGGAASPLRSSTNAAASVVPREQQRRRATQLAMALDTTNNPITSKVYGRADTKGGSKTPDMNEEIAASGIEEVRCVISVKGMDEQLGIMSTQQALQRASDEGLDLVMITKDAQPPVVKIIDYGKFKYKRDRRKKDNKAKHKATEMKEVKMSYKIETHDYMVRLRNAQKFVKQGHRVRIVVTFRGREQSHMDLGNVLLDKVTNDLEGLALVEPKRREGNRLSMIVFPKPTT